MLQNHTGNAYWTFGTNNKNQNKKKNTNNNLHLSFSSTEQEQAAQPLTFINELKCNRRDQKYVRKLKETKMFFCVIISTAHGCVGTQKEL